MESGLRTNSGLIWQNLLKTGSSGLIIFSGGRDDCDAYYRRRSSRTASQGLKKCRPLYTMGYPNINNMRVSPGILFLCKNLKDRCISNVVWKEIERQFNAELDVIHESELNLHELRANSLMEIADQ
ncbi:hypothetical protein SADUNF_Sadunf01G0147800 [Salix dunnii]|uniref:Uncharacterized protein n=1 Tax=Salix dunnii TaxID=1413687 RepID=A0A835NCE4_9ROSI|nr:hypothetical protein SADUNF_Sadunf01G0147800 [Salix dunnii]